MDHIVFQRRLRDLDADRFGGGLGMCSSAMAGMARAASTAAVEVVADVFMAGLVARSRVFPIHNA